ncbi:MAG: hypothetical protein J6B50_09550, partial [Lachnospiraceae bacterium]|nr:hypothetical protein [Lachnospiraceae bacterium]
LGINILLGMLFCGDLIISYGCVYAYSFVKKQIGSKLYPQVKFRTSFFRFVKAGLCAFSACILDIDVIKYNRLCKTLAETAEKHIETVCCSVVSVSYTKIR